jgi:hypothetical protein
MEQKNNQTRELDQITTLLADARLENYDHIQLTDEETAEALRQARSRKATLIHERAYLDKLNQPRQYLKFDYESLHAFIFQKFNLVYLNDKERIKRLKEQKLKPYYLDEYNQHIFEMLCQYFTGDPGFEMHDEDFSLDKGIMFFGGVGCGKTSMLRMFTVNSHKPFAIYSCRSIAQEYAKDGPVSLDKYASLQPCYPQQNYGIDLLGRSFDDLGTEDNKSNFGNKVNVMQDIFYKIYDSNLFGDFHNTTNLTADEIGEFYGKRVRSRLNEMFNIIPFDPEAPDRRTWSANVSL